MRRNRRSTSKRTESKPDWSRPHVHEDQTNNDDNNNTTTTTTTTTTNNNNDNNSNTSNNNNSTINNDNELWVDVALVQSYNSVISMIMAYCMLSFETRRDEVRPILGGTNCLTLLV